MKRRIIIVLSALLTVCAVMSGCKDGNVGDKISEIAGGLFDHEEKVYDSIPERWQNEHVNDHEAAKEVIEALLASADEGNKEAFAKNFTAELRKSAGFDKLLDDFFAAYPGGLSKALREDGPVSAGGSYAGMDSRKGGATHFICRPGGKWFRINLSFCYENTAEPDKIGVESFLIMNLEAYAVHTDMYSRDCLYYDDMHLLCDIRSSDEVKARRINGGAYLWTDTDAPKLTADEMRELLTRYRDLGAREVREKIGLANAEQKFFNNTGYDYYYELVPENGEPRYAQICTNSSYGDIIDAYICSADDIFFDVPLCPFIKP